MMRLCLKPLRTNAQFLEYIKTKFVFTCASEARHHANLVSSYFPYITDEQMEALAIAYPDDVTQVRELSLVSAMSNDYNITDRVHLSTLELVML
jgi:hypothetical protein